MNGRAPQDREIEWYVIPLILAILVIMSLLLARFAPSIPSMR
jgi:hypothetical protein